MNSLDQMVCYARLFHIGDRVRHRRFGTGQVIEITGQNLIWISVTLGANRSAITTSTKRPFNEKR